MKNGKGLDQILYEAYCERAGWKSAVTGAPLPQWEDCSNPVKGCWWAVAEAAIEWANDAADQLNEAARPGWQRGGCAMMDYPSIEQLLERAAEEGGAIVCSVRCNSTEIDEAQAEGRMTVTDAGYGFIWRPNEDAELAALRAKAAAFDWLAAMKGVEITQGGQTWAIWDTQGTTARFIASGKTLAEAVRLALEAEEQ